jgi:hypothetical protein
LPNCPVNCSRVDDKLKLGTLCNVVNDAFTLIKKNVKLFRVPKSEDIGSWAVDNGKKSKRSQAVFEGTQEAFINGIATGKAAILFKHVITKQLRFKDLS